jgi:TPR repeat protein
MAIAFALCAHDASAQPKRKPQAKPKPAAAKPATEHDPLTEWELVQGAAVELRARIAKAPKIEALRQDMADLARRSAIGAERALAIGNATLFESYREQFQEQFRDTLWRLGRMAGQGDGAAHYAAGVVALHGFLDKASVEAACTSFAAALAAGYNPARFRASQCLEKSDPAKAAELLRAAADSGHPAAAELAGRACLEAKPQDADCAWTRLTAAAAAGRPTAQSLLAWMHVQGVGGRTPDPARALRLYRQAAQAGHAPAQNNLGELYETGRGAPADPKQALEWYRKAAEAGFAPGQFNLGRLHAAGTGTPRDFKEARKWLEQAERGGIADARRLIRWMEQKVDEK